MPTNIQNIHTSHSSTTWFAFLPIKCTKSQTHSCDFAILASFWRRVAAGRLATVGGRQYATLRSEREEKVNKCVVLLHLRGRWVAVGLRGKGGVGGALGYKSRRVGTLHPHTHPQTHSPASEEAGCTPGPPAETHSNWAPHLVREETPTSHTWIILRQI